MLDQDFCSLTHLDFSNEYNKGVVLLSTLPQPNQVKLKKKSNSKKGNLENSAETHYYNNFAVQLDLNHKILLT